MLGGYELYSVNEFEISTMYSFFLLHSGEPPPGVLCPALGSPVQEGHGPVRACPEEGHEDGQGAGAPLL